MSGGGGTSSMLATAAGLGASAFLGPEATLGEQALLGAVAGGATSALTGGNAMSGALLGGAGGGIGQLTGGLGGSLYNLSPTAISGGSLATAGNQAGAAALGGGIDPSTLAGQQSLGNALSTAGLDPSSAAYQQALANQATFAQGAGSQVAGMQAANPMSTASSTVGNFIGNHPYMTAGLALAGLPLIQNIMTGRGNNYLPNYVQPTYGLMGAAPGGIQVARPMAAGGSVTPSVSPTYTPTSYGSIMPTGGVAPADLTAAPQTNNLQSLIASALPSNTPQSTLQSLTSQAQSGLSAYGLAEGGITSLPQAQRLTQSNSYNMPAQSPVSAQQAMANTATNVNPLTGMPVKAMAVGGMAAPAYNPNSELMTQYMMQNMSGMPNIVPTGNAKGGPISGNGNLGSYSDGGQMLQGPGDGMSDSIPATIGGAQPARLAQGEFVVPADVVSHLGNGSTDAGAKQLYAMMDKVRKARTGNPKQGKQINPSKYMPA